MSRRSGFLSGLFLGGLAGAVIGVLYAPRPGEETREKLTEKGEEVASGLKTMVVRAAGGGEDVIGNVKSILLDLTGLLSDTLKTLRREIREETADLRQMSALDPAYEPFGDSHVDLTCEDDEAGDA